MTEHTTFQSAAPSARHPNAWFQLFPNPLTGCQQLFLLQYSCCQGQTDSMRSFAMPDNSQCLGPIKCNSGWQNVRSGWQKLSLPGPAVPKWASYFEEPGNGLCPGVLNWTMYWSEPLKMPDIHFSMSQGCLSSFTWGNDAYLSRIFMSWVACMNHFFEI